MTKRSTVIYFPYVTHRSVWPPGAPPRNGAADRWEGRRCVAVVVRTVGFSQVKGRRLYLPISPAITWSRVWQTWGETRVAYLFDRFRWAGGSFHEQVVLFHIFLLGCRWFFWFPYFLFVLIFVLSFHVIYYCLFYFILFLLCFISYFSFSLCCIFIWFSCFLFIIFYSYYLLVFVAPNVNVFLLFS